MKKIMIIVLSCYTAVFTHGMDLVKAAKKGQIERVQELLLWGTIIDIKNNDGDTPLHKAVEKGHQKVVKLLLAQGADVHAKNNLGQTPLYRAAYKGHFKIVTMLMRYNAYVNVQDTYGNTPLHFAVMSGKPKIVKAILSKKADVNAQDSAGNAPLHRAALYKHHGIIKILLAHGANGDIPNNIGKTIYQWAFDTRCFTIIKLIKNNRLKRVSKNMLSFLVASHARVGSHCYAHSLDQQIFRTIFELLREEICAQNRLHMRSYKIYSFKNI